MFGVLLANVVQLKCTYLRGRWMQHQILQSNLVPFISSHFSSGHRFMQDNDPKHTSRKAKDFFAARSINWWKTPPESLDMNPIENLWHELNTYEEK